MQLIAISTDERPRLEITYKGAQASRPADTISVEEFVGVKSCKAKGKRLTTFDVDTLTFIEPEVVEPEEPENEVEPTDEEPVEKVIEVEEEKMTVVQPVDNSGTPIEIIRNDIDEGNTEQLNLF